MAEVLCVPVARHSEARSPRVGPRQPRTSHGKRLEAWRPEAKPSLSDRESLTPAIGNDRHGEGTRVVARDDREAASIGDQDRDALYAEFQPLVRRLMRQYGSNPEIRRDLANEIYCRFCALVTAYDPDRGVPLRGYIVRTLTASVYSYARSQWRLCHRETSLTQGDQEYEYGRAYSFDPTPHWDDQLELQEVLQGLPEAISRLPFRQRQVVIWRYYESRSFEEIAELLSVRPATARSLLRHGLNHLRRHLCPTEVRREPSAELAVHAHLPS